MNHSKNITKFPARNFEDDQCISFVSKLVYYARMTQTFDIDTFYMKHKDDLIAMSTDCLNFFH